MNTPSDPKITKPSIVQAFLSGFNTVANKPSLLFIPILLDLFLWFGPALRIDQVFNPLIQNLTLLPGADSVEVAKIFENYQVLLQEALANFNLTVSLHTIPIGVPSLIVSKPSFINPLGQPITFSLATSSQFIVLWLMFILIGFFLASFYLQKISNQVISLFDQSFKTLTKAFLQILLIPITLLILLMVFSIPFALIISFITMISPTVSQLLIMMASIFVLWALMPLIFTPHGIFLYQQNLIAAMVTSIKVVRISMTQTAWFILMSFLLIQGMNYLWLSPNADNWLLFVGVFGHAFIASAVIAGSFHFYIDATRFSQFILKQQEVKTT